MESKAVQSTDTNIAVEPYIPAPPITLSKKAKDFYYEMCQSLINDNTFFTRDYMAVALFCESMDMYIKVCKILKKPQDCVEHYKNGSNINGYFTLRKQLRKELQELMPQLGIGIRSRERSDIFLNVQMQLFQAENKAADPWREHTDDKPQLKTIDI